MASNPRVRRKWLRPADRVFISYAWTNPHEAPEVVRSLAKALDMLDVRYFFDKHSVPGSFAPWRQIVSLELLAATHLFVVLEPHLLQGDTVLNEISTAMERWETEVFPAVVCIVDPQVASAIQPSDDASQQLKKVLRNSARVPPEQVANAEMIERAIESHRFQGLARDWLTLVWPRAQLGGWLYERSIPEALESFGKLSWGREALRVRWLAVVLSYVVISLGRSRGPSWPTDRASVTAVQADGSPSQTTKR